MYGENLSLTPVTGKRQTQSVVSCSKQLVIMTLAISERPLWLEAAVGGNALDHSAIRVLYLNERKRFGGR